MGNAREFRNSCGRVQMTTSTRLSVGAIELELFRHFLVSIAEEMGIVLRRSVRIR